MPLMQRHIDIYRHKVIMGIHTKARRAQKDPEGDFDENDRESNISTMNELEYN